MMRVLSRTAQAATAGALCVLLFSGTARAQGTVGITPTVTGGGSALFHYSYTVTNNTSTELAIVSFQSLFGSAVTNTAAPAGFFTSYDSGNGFISFAPDQSGTGSFAPNSTVGAFTFDSPFAATAVPFSAMDIGGTEITGTTLAPAPEPGVLAPLAIGALGLGLLGVRARRRASAF